MGSQRRWVPVQVNVSLNVRSSCQESLRHLVSLRHLAGRAVVGLSHDHLKGMAPWTPSFCVLSVWGVTSQFSSHSVEIFYKSPRLAALVFPFNFFPSFLWVNEQRLGWSGLMGPPGCLNFQFSVFKNPNFVKYPPHPTIRHGRVIIWKSLESRRIF